MRIGLLTSVPSTVDAFFPAWVNAWRETGHEVVPATGPGPNGEAAKVPGSIVLPGIGRTPSGASPGSLEPLRRWAAEVDVVVTNTATASALVRLAGIRPPVVYFCHGLHWSGRPGLRDLPWVGAERALLPRTAGVVCLNGEDEEWFVRHAPTGVGVLRLPAGVGLDLADWPPSPLPPVSGALRLVTVGQLIARKRPVDAVGVLSLLHAAGVDARLVMLGAGPMRDALAAEAAWRGLADRLELPGVGDPRPAMSHAHAVLHPAAWEGLPRVLLEAHAVGRPAFGYDVKGVRDAPGANVSGRPGDVASLAGSVVRWWRDGAPAVAAADRGRLDWRVPWGEVTALLERVASVG